MSRKKQIQKKLISKKFKIKKELLASLPKPIARQMEILVVSQAIEVIHCERRTYFHETMPSFYLSSIKFEFDLTIKKEFESTKEFLDLKL